MISTDITNLTPVDFAKVISVYFWSRIKFARNIKPKGRLRISEASLTEELVYQFYTMAANRILPVKIFQSTNEKVNGSDLEILLELDGSVVKLPCQAKIIYATQRYGALYHKVGHQLQIDLLIQHAKKIGGYPISEIKNKFFKKRTTPPMFRDMHPGTCWPFYQLFEFLNTKEADKGIANILNGFDLTSLTRYRIDEILDDPRFSDLTSPEALGFVDHFDKAPSILINKRKLLQEPSEFNPRFRILITKDNLNNGSLQFLD